MPSSCRWVPRGGAAADLEVPPGQGSNVLDGPLLALTRSVAGLRNGATSHYGGAMRPNSMRHWVARSPSGSASAPSARARRDEHGRAARCFAHATCAASLPPKSAAHHKMSLRKLLCARRNFSPLCRCAHTPALVRQNQTCIDRDGMLHPTKLSQIAPPPTPSATATHCPRPPAPAHAHPLLLFCPTLPISGATEHHILRTWAKLYNRVQQMISAARNARGVRPQGGADSPTQPAGTRQRSCRLSSPPCRARSHRRPGAEIARA